MTLDLGKIQEYAKITDGGPLVLTRVRPCTRITRREEGVDPIYVFIQGGTYYSEDGKVIPTGMLPAWLDDEIAKMTPAARKEVGLQDWEHPGD